MHIKLICALRTKWKYAIRFERGKKEIIRSFLSVLEMIQRLLLLFVFAHNVLCFTLSLVSFSSPSPKRVIFSLSLFFPCWTRYRRWFLFISLFYYFRGCFSLIILDCRYPLSLSIHLHFVSISLYVHWRGSIRRKKIKFKKPKQGTTLKKKSTKYKYNCGYAFNCMLKQTAKRERERDWEKRFDPCLRF